MNKTVKVGLYTNTKTTQDIFYSVSQDAIAESYAFKKPR